MIDHPDQSSLPFVASMTTRINRHAAAYASEIAEHLATAHDHRPEQLLLDSFNTHVETVLASYDPPGVRRRGDSLVFADSYAEARSPLPGARRSNDVPVEFLAALLAAEVEFRGPLRSSRTQNTMLARVYERLGECLSATGLPGHATLAFGRATGLHRQNEDEDAADRCGLARARAQCRARHPRWRRIGGQLSDLLCGYGYRPFRLLMWMLLQLLLFTVAISWLADTALHSSLYLCLINFLNPAGMGDTEAVGRTGRALLVIESYAGTVSMSVFFALLVRRWFRL
ncbi:hypothetical protein APR12_005945 [Nocardia amikacinitolerans]|uniref:hypothetical protein n=1 Tax=Nocardia amikacinitolerans TaxID=756689 RepID=UPI000836719E|nr:hypothetical protein [Nocardia amikacinitolerans]MCP2320563.1 hypothetical protein [Nocardia amikacinitolerans]